MTDETIAPSSSSAPPAPEMTWFQRWTRRFVLWLWATVVRFQKDREEDWGHLRSDASRKEIMRALAGSHTMTPGQRRALVVAILGFLLVAWASVTVVLLLVWPDIQSRFQRSFTLGLYSLATSLFLPTPYELVMIPAASKIGQWSAILISSGAKAAGTFLVLSAGHTANVLLNRVLARTRRWSRAFDKLQAVAGHPLSYVFAFVMFAIPFNSDTMILYLLAPLGLRRTALVMVTFGAFVVRGLLVFEAATWF